MIQKDIILTQSGNYYGSVCVTAGRSYSLYFITWDGSLQLCPTFFKTKVQLAYLLAMSQPLPEYDP